MSTIVRWDLAAYDQHNRLALVVEVKSKLDRTSEWAAQLRRNILASGTYPNAPYFLMVFPDRFYLWKNAVSSNEAIEPTYQIDANSVLQPYFDRSGISPSEVSGQGLEIIIASWLNTIMHKASHELEPSQQWLNESGLYDAIVGGHLEREVLV